MATSGGGGWAKSPPELVERFETGTAPFLTEPGISRRQMFGYPACFADGHMFTSLFGDRWVVRLPDDARAELARLGGSPFEPMPGRPMNGYALLPADLADPYAAHPWLVRALAHVRTLPPKTPRPRAAKPRAAKRARGTA